MFGIIVLLQDEELSNGSGGIYWNLSRKKNVFIHLRIHCANAISSYIISEDMCASTCSSLAFSKL